MASSTSTLAQQPGVFSLPAIAKLARWRFKHMWRFLFVTWLGLLAMVTLVCSGPLFTRVANSAYVRSLIATAPDGPYITNAVMSLHPTVDQVQQIEQVTDQALHQGAFAPYLHEASQLSIQTPSFDLVAGGQTKQAAFHIDGYDSAQTAQHTTVVEGRLPQTTSSGVVEIALSQVAATALGLHVGSTFQGNYPVSLGSQAWNFEVVGIIAPKATQDTFWAMANPFSTSMIALNSRYYRVTGDSSSYGVLAANEAIRPKIAVLQSSDPGNNFSDAFVLFLRYPFDLAHLDAGDLSGLSQQAASLDNGLQNKLSRAVQDLAYANIFGTAFTTLNFNSLDSVTIQLEAGFLMLITLALVLFLVSLMADVLVERQAAIIATLRSRGATRGHIFGAFAGQGVVLGIVALLVGPLLAIVLVQFMARALLSPGNQQAINVLTAHPFQAILDVKWYAIAAVVVALLVMVLAINRAAKIDIVGWRREAARPRRVSLWKRLYLDVFLVVVLLLGYGVYAYFWPFLSGSSTRIDPVLYNVLTGIGWFSTPLIVAAVLMLFLRVFPLILRLATRLVGKLRSAPGVLALAQAERTPRHASRIIVLLALTIASSCFLFTLITSKEQRNIDAATFSTEAADFSGTLPTTDATRTFEQLKTYYSGVTGVQSATLGHRDVVPLSPTQDVLGQGTLTIDAVDANTYASTAIWPASYSSQQLAKLTKQLVAHRADASTQNVVYALVDLATWQRLHLTQGQQFSLPIDSANNARANFIALAQINYVPGVYDTPSLAWSGMGVIVDYQSYAAVKAKVEGTTASSVLSNYIWLRTNTDAASLARLRNTLPALSDRNQVIDTISNDPGHIGIIGVLYIGVVTAFLLALVGTLILSWLNASTRLTNFAVARALGMSPRQIAAILLWEQGLVYVLGVVLGVVLGIMLMLFVGPSVGSLPVGYGLNTGFNVPAIQVVVPYLQLLALLGVLAVVCLVALLLMARIVSRPLPSQTLRLNED